MSSPSPSMVSPLKVGFFQTLEPVSADTLLIRDELYGAHTISEPVLVELLRSAELLRLTGVCQHGVTGLLGLTPRVTRFEHSVGAFLLVRKVGGSLQEQVAALLHDISHTTLSHVIDWALTKPGEESFHEVRKARYVETMTALPQILAKHGMGDAAADLEDCSVLNEDLYPLVEMPSPHLCADRLDYALRDAVAFGKLAVDDAQRILASLRAFPDASSSRRLLVLEDEHLALVLARAYLASDRDVWSNEAHTDMSRRIGQLIGEMIRRGVVKEETLWRLSDQEFWELLRSVADPEGLELMRRLETEGLPKEEDLIGLPEGTKIRTLDPDVLLQMMQEPLPLSTVRPEWGRERQDYIASRGF